MWINCPLPDPHYTPTIHPCRILKKIILSIRKRLVHMVNLLTLEHAICHLNHTVNNHPHIVHHALKGKPSKIIIVSPSTCISMCIVHVHRIKF